MNSIIDGSIGKAVIRKLHGMKYVCENICLNIVTIKITVPLKNVSITLLDRADGRNSNREKITGLGHPRPIYHLDLALKTASDQLITKSCMLLKIFDILVKPGTVLGQDF